MTLHPSRRDALILSGKAVLGLMAAFPGLTSCGTDPSIQSAPMSSDDVPPSLLDWNSFLDQIEALAEVQFAPVWNQEAYVHDVSELLKVLDLTAPEVDGFFNHYNNASLNFPEINEVHWQESFQVSTLEFEANEVIGLHDHPEMTGVILCCGGKLETENYTLLEESSESGGLLLRQDSRIVMTPGSIATLTSTTRNIHSLRATEFTRLIDVFTPSYDDFRSRTSKWYQKDSETYQGSEGIYEAQAY